MRQFTAKLGNMRKEQDFVVYPRSYSGKDEILYIQADKACAMFDINTGKGVMSNKGSAPMDYYLTFKGQPFTCPQEVIDKALACSIPKGVLHDTGMGVLIQG